MNVKPSLCPNGCGQPGPHFVPPSMGEPGFYHCTPLVTEPEKKKSFLDDPSYPFSFPIRPEKKAEDLHREFQVYPSTLLTKVSLVVQPEEMALLTAAFVEEMVKLCQYRRGYSVAGVQVGMLRRFFVMTQHPTLNDGKPYPTLWVNPRVVQESAETAYMLEGCLSLLGQTRKGKHLAHLSRPAAVVVECDTIGGGEPWRFGCSGLMARVVQHEIDHLDGKLFTSRLSPIEFEKVRPLLQDMTAAYKLSLVDKGARR